ncbi:coiled-coil domain-containing protein 138-like isoform X2 [Betta splendens]|uniref:Coiled-coil domain-containing protein 138-like isoform X2 n=1 Tax=Betta splendens TaxID=158456 RepID=A0A6P7LCL0_BETSP|nr:coiled-coil domain-containing protein 138-like isoform X2 [Betta splendens]
MNTEYKECDAADEVQRIRQKYELRQAADFPPGATDDAQRHVLTHRTKQSRDLKCYSTALRELFTAVANNPDQFDCDRRLHGSNEDLSGDFMTHPLQESQALFTETDVTLPSCLDGSPGSHEAEAEADGGCHWAPQIPDSCRSASLVLAQVYQEMMSIYKQLKAERQSQQQWERELFERERRLKQREEAVGMEADLEDMIHARILAVEEKHQQELSELQDLLRERSKENKRLKSSFDNIKELNDNMRKQLNEISEQNKKLESQSKRVQARLENLQRKYEHSTASRGCQRGNARSPECIKQSKKAAAPGKLVHKGSISPTTLRLLALLLDWLTDAQVFSSEARNEGKAAQQPLAPRVGLNERCLKVLPLLADQLRHTDSPEPEFILNLLRLIHSALRHLDSTTQHVALSATLRRIGEEVSKPTAQGKDPGSSKSSGEAAGHFRSWPLYRSPCPHTRILSILIILHTVTQADVVVQALTSLHTELMTVESRGLFLHHGGVHVLLSLIRTGRGGLHTPIDILMQLSEQSRYLNPFLDACSCEDFFRTTSQLLKHSRLELPSLEKISMLLQKLSSIRKNQRLFELSSLHLHLQDLCHNRDHTHTFLCLNLRSILHNLK